MGRGRDGDRRIVRPQRKSRARKDPPSGTTKTNGIHRLLKAEWLPIELLKLDPNNPRAHSPKQIDQIAHSVLAFGFNVPILVDAALRVITGHGRLLAARQLGLHQVPVIRLKHLSESQARAFALADNRLTDNSTWDERLLASQLKELAELDLDFDLEATGFEMGEIDLCIEGLTEAKDDDPLADALPIVPTGPAVSHAGDLWLLGRHRLVCGSALDDRAYASIMQREHASLVFIDPPYNVRINGNVSGLGAIQHREFPMGSGEMNEAEFTQFLTDACALLAQHSIEGAIHFICMDWRHISELLAAGRQVYAGLKNICVWVKDHSGMGSLYRSRYELVFVYKHGRGTHRNNIQLGQFGRDRSNVWTYRGANSFGRMGDEGNLLALHPTVKPVDLVADAIMDCSARGDIVLDAFLGSGTTVIAAERVGRRCYGIELDSLYVDTIIRRWQNFTGDDAKHATSNRTFNELQMEISDGNR
jgi:DNA modification methylase